VLLLTGEDVRQLLGVDDALEAVTISFEALSAGNVESWRSFLDMSQHGGTLLAMSAQVKGLGGAGLKVIAVYKDNMAKFGLPSAQATILLFKPSTGELLAMMDGSHLTAMRTAAGSALATKHLSRLDSHTLGIIGTGAQGRTHVLAISRVREIKRILAYDSDRSRMASFVGNLSRDVHSEIREAESPKQLVRESDIIVTATTSPVPVFDGEWLRKGTHINSIMSITPTMRELDDRTVSMSRIVVDDFESAMREAGDIIQPIAGKLISPKDIDSLGDVISGKRPGRTNEDEVTVFKSVGVPSHDVCAALKVYDKATRLHVGRSFMM